MNTDRVLDLLEKFSPISEPSAEDIENPDYPFYALAPNISKTGKSSRTTIPLAHLISWAESQNITIPTELSNGMSHQSEVDYLCLPETFPDQINFSGRYNAKRIERNLRKPRHVQQSEHTAPNPLDIEVLRPDNEDAGKKDTLKESQRVKLTEGAQKIYDEVMKERKRVVYLALQEMFKDDEARSEHLHLIEQLGVLDENGFEIYSNGRKPRDLIVEHRCRAIGQLLRSFESDIRIDKLETHDLMEKYGRQRSLKTTPKTFRNRMNREGIYDRDP